MCVLPVDRGGVLFDHRDPVLGQGLAKDGDHFRLGSRGDPADDGHPGAQMGEELGLFDTDVATADDDHGVGQFS